MLYNPHNQQSMFKYIKLISSINGLLNYRNRFWTVIPFGCFFIPCCKASTMRKRDFRILYNLIIQYAYLSPIFAFGKLVWSVKEQHIMIMIFVILTLISAALCFYALLALLTATSSLLKHYDIHLHKSYHCCYDDTTNISK